MRVGVDASCWINGRGYGRFTRELLGTMVRLAPDDRFTFFADPWTHARFDLAGPNVETVPVRLSTAPSEAASAEGNRAPADMLRLTRAVWVERPDVFFSPSVFTYFPLPPGRPAVVAIHDAIAERFPELTLPTPRARLYWNAKVRLAVWQARLILTVSDYAARELTAVLGIPAERIRVAGEAPAAAYTPSRSPEEIEAAARGVGLPPGARWIVYVGGFNPHKRIDLVIRAHAALVAAAGDPPVHLLLVGSHGDRFHKDLRPLHEAIAAAGTEPLVHWTGFVPDETLRHLHSGALCLVLPSESEGFGLPAVEAAACATPVVATTESPLPELLEGGGAFVPPGDADALAAALVALCADEARRKRAGERARERASRLSWERSALVALAALREAAM